MQCTKGMLVAICGNVTKEFYTSRSGDREISRTIIVEDILSTGGSLQPEVAHPADIDHDIKTRLTDLVPETEPLPDDGLPDLD
jgi:single-stranded DNA-binding protein